jgi:hypothetical protein
MKYQFRDVSHWKGKINHQVFADRGDRFAISKAADLYNMANKNGEYTWPPGYAQNWDLLNHTDSRFVENHVGFRKVGMIAGHFMFNRFDRPRNVSKSVIVAKNLQYYLDAINLLPEEYREEAKSVGIADAEQAGGQLRAAGLDRNEVSAMLWDVIQLYVAEFNHVILYSGSWWTDEWVTDDVMEKIAQVASVWEPEYKRLNPLTGKPLPGAKFTVPHGFSTTFATSTDTLIGNTFAWQFTNKNEGRYDDNFYAMPKSELYKMYGQDGAVVPPSDPQNPPQENPQVIELDSGEKVTVKAK